MILFLGCEEENWVKRTLTIFNHYESNQRDNYEGEIYINFRLESDGWIWAYKGYDRPSILTGYGRSWIFRMREGLDSVYVHGRFLYASGLEDTFVFADTTLNLDRDRKIEFWNCGDSSREAFPFPACFKILD